MTIHYDSTITAPSSGTLFRGSTATVTREAPVEPPTGKTGGRHQPPRWQKATLVGAIVAGLAAVTVFAVANDSGNDTPAVEVGELSQAQSAEAQRLAEQANGSSVDAASSATPTARELIDEAITDAQNTPAPTSRELIDESITEAVAANEATVTEQRLVDSSVRAIEAAAGVDQPSVLDSSVRAIEAAAGVDQPSVLDSSVRAIEAKAEGQNGQ